MKITDDMVHIQDSFAPGKYRPVVLEGSDAVVGYILEFRNWGGLNSRINQAEFPLIAKVFESPLRVVWQVDAISALRLIADGLMEPANADSQED